MERKRRDPVEVRLDHRLSLSTRSGEGHQSLFVCLFVLRNLDCSILLILSDSTLEVILLLPNMNHCNNKNQHLLR